MRRGRHYCRPFSFPLKSFLLQLKPRDAWGFPFSFCSGGRNGTVALPAASLGHSATRGDRHSAERRRWPMRAYVTTAGMALGLVAVWAVLVPLVA